MKRHNGYAIDQKVWLTVYKDSLGFVDEQDNLAEILVPKTWLLDKLKADGISDFKQWENEYTADSTEHIAALALEENVIQGCAGIDILEDGAKVEYLSSFYEVVDVKDGLVWLQDLNNDHHVELRIEKLLKEAMPVLKDEPVKESLDGKITAAASIGEKMVDSNSSPDKTIERD